MKCIYCGAEIESGALACPICGKTIEPQDIFSSSGKPTQEDSFAGGEEKRFDFDKIDFESFAAPLKSESEPPIAQTQQATKKRKSRKGIIVAAVTIILIIAAIVLSLMFYAGPAAKIGRHLKEGKYDAAYSLFLKNYDESGSTLLNSKLTERLDALYSEYKNGEKEYSEAKGELSTIEKMKVSAISERVKKTSKKLDALKASMAAFEKAEDYYSRNNFELAITEYKKVIKEDPGFDAAKKKKQQAENNFKNNAISKADEYASKSDYDSAIKTLENALKIIKNDNLLKSRLKKYQNSISFKSDETILRSAEEAAEKKDYTTAIATLSSALKNNEFKDTKKAESLLKYYREEYEDIFKKELKKLTENNDYVAAAALIHQAGQFIPESSVLEDETEKIAELLPIYLDELDPATASDWQFGGVATDSFGIDRSSEPNVIILRVGSSASYQLDGSYSELIFTVSAAKEIDTTANCKLKITAEKTDGEPTMRECEVSAKTEAAEITVDIADCETLTFEVSGEGANILMSSIMLVR